MTEGFYNHFLDFFLGLIIIMLGSLTAVECITLFFITLNGWFLTVFSIASMVTLFYSLRYLQKFREFKQDLYLFFPKNVNITSSNLKDDKITDELEKIALNNEDLTLKVCHFYSKDCSLSEIAEKLGLSHPETAKRLLIKGLKQLLEAKTP